MGSLFKLIAAPMIAMALLRAQVQAGEVDRYNPIRAATGFLNAFKARDVVAMAKFSNAKNKEMFDDLAANGEASEFYKTVFAGQKFETVSAWDGAVGQARRYNFQAIVPFHGIHSDVVAVVVLTQENGVWGLKDISRISNSQLENLPILQTTP